MFIMNIPSTEYYFGDVAYAIPELLPSLEENADLHEDGYAMFPAVHRNIGIDILIFYTDDILSLYGEDDTIRADLETPYSILCPLEFVYSSNVQKWIRRNDALYHPLRTTVRIATVIEVEPSDDASYIVSFNNGILRCDSKMKNKLTVYFPTIDESDYEEDASDGGCEQILYNQDNMDALWKHYEQVWESNYVKGAHIEVVDDSDEDCPIFEA
jgi:hypothetical protein